MCPVPIPAPVGCTANKGVPCCWWEFSRYSKVPRTNLVDDKAIAGHCTGSHRLRVEAAHLTGGARHFPFAVAPIPGQCWPRGRWRGRKKQILIIGPVGTPSKEFHRICTVVCKIFAAQTIFEVAFANLLRQGSAYAAQDREVQARGVGTQGLNFTLLSTLEQESTC